MLVESIARGAVLENNAPFSSFSNHMFASEQVAGLCNKIENFWEENKALLAPGLQFAQCEENVCTWGDRKEYAIRYLRNEEGCALQINSEEDQAKFSIMGDTHIFSMAKPHSLMSAKTDYVNFVSANWHSTEGVMTYGNLKVERTQDANGEEVFTFELANTTDDREANFSAECRLGENEAVCEINRGDILSKWFLGNKVIVSMDKTIDAKTQEETVTFAVQTKPLFGVLSGFQLGKFEATFNPNGAFSAEGNLRLPGSAQPLFAGKFNCRDPETCNGEGNIDYTIDLGNGSYSGEKARVEFDSDHQHCHYHVNEQNDLKIGDRHRHLNNEIDMNLQLSEHGMQFTQDMKEELETEFINNKAHIKAEAQLDTSNGIKVDCSIKDLSQPDAVKTQFLAAYDYNIKDPKADTYRIALQLLNGFEAEGKARVPK